jgi:hypothetical protein
MNRPRDEIVANNKILKLVPSSGRKRSDLTAAINLFGVLFSTFLRFS